MVVFGSLWTGLVFVVRVNTILGYLYWPSTRLRSQNFDNGLQNESRVDTPIRRNLVLVDSCWTEIVLSQVEDSKVLFIKKVVHKIFPTLWTNLIKGGTFSLPPCGAIWVSTLLVFIPSCSWLIFSAIFNTFHTVSFVKLLLVWKAILIFFYWTIFVLHHPLSWLSFVMWGAAFLIE